jgi:hypothetical protein
MYCDVQNDWRSLPGFQRFSKSKLVQKIYTCMHTYMHTCKIPVYPGFLSPGDWPCQFQVTICIQTHIDTHIYVCMYIYIYIYTHTNIYTHIHIHTFIYAYMHAKYLYTQASCLWEIGRVHSRSCMMICMYVCMYACMYECVSGRFAVLPQGPA